MTEIAIHICFIFKFIKGGEIVERIYLDHAATTPMHPQVIEEMVRVMKQNYGNASSIHFFGRESRKLLDDSRVTLAKSIGAKPNEIIITSGGTEADNYAIFGVADAYKEKGKHIITTSIEHHAVLNACKHLERRGYEVTYLPVNEKGKISLQDLKNALRDDTILVTIMFGNNEVGTIQDIAEIGKIVAEHQAVFHTDAVQAYGIVSIDVKELNIDLLSVSAHKINGPKGIGFLFAKEGIKLTPILFGGEQERKRRAGTENIPGVAGFAKAVSIAQSTIEARKDLYVSFKKKMIEVFQEENIEFRINGTLEESLAHVLNVSFPGTNVEAMLVNLDLAGIAASSGSACTAGSIDPSHVLVAMYGADSDRGKNSIRFSFGLNNTLEDVEKAARETAKIVKRLTN